MKKFISILSVVSVMLMISSCAGVKKTAIEAPEADIGDVKWELYPDPRTVNVTPKEEIVFKLTPTSTDSNFKKIIIYFGDGASKEYDLAYRKGGHLPVFYFSHTYQNDNIYKPFVKYKNNGESYHLGDIEFIIAPKVMSDEEMKEVVVQDMIEKLEQEISKVIDKNDKLAFSLLEDANFEYDDKYEEDERIIHKIIQYIVSKEYTVLEKTPQALIRLAHEALVRLDESGKMGENYLDSLEYGLMTKYEGPPKPFHYGIKIEGVRDRQSVEDEVAGEAEDHGERSKKRVEAGVKQKKSQKESERATRKKKSLKTRPLFYAKFDTADYLLVISRPPDGGPDIKKSKKKYYNIKYEEEMIERTASVKINARILRRNGTIKWIKDIKGETKNRAIARFIPVSPPKTESTSIKNLFRKKDKKDSSEKAEDPSLLKDVLNILPSLIKKKE